MYIYECRNCGNTATFDQDNINWICICQQKPRGQNQFFHCLECGNRRWGKSNECEVCFASKLNERKITVEHFGDMKNIPVRTNEQRLEQFEKHYQRQEEIQRQIIQNKIDTNKAILAVPKLLTELNNKLDKLTFEPDENEIEYDEEGWVKF